MQKEYQYFAFISYKREDVAHAKWLQKKLQNYRLPASLQKSSGRPERLAPVFRDQDDLRPGRLKENLESALASSRFLIVICSRNAQRKSTYLDLEIRGFLEHGHTVDDIIPLIVDEECEKPEIECFPAELRRLNEQYEVLGANFKDSSEKTEKARKHDAFLKIVAQMLGVMMPELKNLDQIRRRKQMAWCGVLASALAAICVYAGVYYWQHIMPHSFYFRDYVVVDQAAQGLDPITEEQAAKERFHYKLTMVDDKIRTLEYRNWAGELTAQEPTALNEGAARVEYSYAGDSLRSAQFYDPKGRLIVCYQFESGGSRIARTRGEESSLVSYLSADPAQLGDPLGTDRSLVSKFVQESENGQVKLRLFAHGDNYDITHNGSNQPEAGSEESFTAMAIYGYALEYDSLGRVVRMTYVNTPQGDTQGTVDGVNAIGYEYNEAGQLEKIVHYNRFGNPVENPEGWAMKVFQWGEGGKLLREEYRNAAGAPTTHRDGYAARVYEYEGLFRSKETTLDLRGNPVALDGYASICYTGDALGRIVGVEYLDDKGEQTSQDSTDLLRQKMEYLSAQETRITYQYQVRNNQSAQVTELRWEGLAPGEDGEEAYVVRSTWTDPENVLEKMDYTTRQAEYDPESLVMVRTSYRTPAGTLRNIHSSQRIALIVQEVNDSGQVTRRREYTQAHDPALGEDQALIRELRYTYDKVGYLAGVYDWKHNAYPEREDTLGLKEADGREVVRDNLGRVFEVRYVNQNGRMMANEDGIAGVQYRYDQAGHLALVTKLDRDALVMEENGHAYRSMEYDNQGNLTAQRYLDMDQTLGVDYDQNYATGITWEYDDGGRPLEEVRCGYDGLPQDDFGKLARVRWEYDDRGNCTRVEYLTAAGDGEYVPYQYASPVGYAAAEWTYDDRGNMTSEHFFDYSYDHETLYSTIPEGESYARAEWTYDEQGNLTSEQFFGPSGYYDTDVLPLEPRGKHYTRAEWTWENGMQTSEFYYDTDGEEVFPAYGSRWEYDAQGKPLTLVEYVGEGEEFVPTQDWPAKTVYSYDDQGRRVRVEWLEYDGEKFVRAVESDTAKQEYTYDEQGNLVTEDYFSFDGERYVPRAGDWPARTEWTYDEMGRKTSETVYGWDGTGYVPLTRSDYYNAPRREWTYSEHGAVLTESTFGWDGEKFVPAAGARNDYARVEYTYDPRGLLTSRAYFGTDGENDFPVEWDGCARMERSYNENGQVTAISYFGTDGEAYYPIQSGAEGYARLEQEYEPDGDLAAVTQYGTEGTALVPKTRTEYVRENGTYQRTELVWDGTAFVPAAKGAGEYSRRLERYDDYGQTLEYAHYNWDGEAWRPVHPQGQDYGRWVREYDWRGNTTIDAYFGTDGENWIPIVSENSGYAKMEQSYDQYGNRTMAAYFGAEDGAYVPIVPTSGYAADQGWARTEMLYDEDGQYQGYRDYITNGTEYFLVEERVDGAYLYYSYDEQFRMISMEAQDGFDKPVEYAPWGFARKEFAYREEDNTSVERIFQMLDGELVRMEETQQTLDGQGRLIREYRYRRYGSWEDEYILEYDYDDAGNRTTQRTYDLEDGQWVLKYEGAPGGS